MLVSVLASGSKGNTTLVQTKKLNILIDAGMNMKYIKERLDFHKEYSEKVSKLTDEEKEMFDKVDIGKGTIAQDELLLKRLPEMPAGLVPIIEEIWLEEVVGK